MIKLLLRIQQYDYKLQVLIVLFYLCDFQVQKKYIIMPIALWYIFLYLKVNIFYNRDLEFAFLLMNLIPPKR